ncbi:hypothetical protein BASA81_012480 [Batrachochytrium salamandrivorans]|nr:hypothetical protein BASA81_012480 [Batrachochytrium salamandrivorans]
MSAMLPAAAAAPPSQSIANGPTLLVKINRKFQKLLDDLTPYTPQRWAGTAILGVLFLIRAFTAAFDPAAEDEFDNDDEGPSLPTRQDDEFRPFIRRLPEFKFWFYSTRAFLIAFGCTLSRVFDLPVFWPILLIYFIILFSITMRRQIMHMIKYKYVPWDFNKKQYNSGTVKSEK